MTRDEVISDMAAVVAGLQVPMSMAMPLGAAMEPWRRLHALSGSGWHDVDATEAALRAALELDQ